MKITFWYASPAPIYVHFCRCPFATGDLTAEEEQMEHGMGILQIRGGFEPARSKAIIL